MKRTSLVSSIKGLISRGHRKTPPRSGWIESEVVLWTGCPAHNPPHNHPAIVLAVSVATLPDRPLRAAGVLLAGAKCTAGLGRVVVRLLVPGRQGHGLLRLAEASPACEGGVLRAL